MLWAEVVHHLVQEGSALAVADAVKDILSGSGVRAVSSDGVTGV